MTDIRERHVHINATQPEGGICDYCDVLWPCDAIREADRADKAEAALAEAQNVAIAEIQRLHGLRDKAEAALAAAQAQQRTSNANIAELLTMVDRAGAAIITARADADALAEALRHCLWQLATLHKAMRRGSANGAGWAQVTRECLDECKPVLAAHDALREATE